jgi:hypothetical protein
MADKVDPFDVEALEKSLNDSATRVSTLWISFLIFGLPRRPRPLARIMHHAMFFCASGELTCGDVPSGGIGMRPLAVRRVRG